MSSKFDEAEAAFARIVEQTSRSENRDERYVHLYAKARLAAMKGSDDLMRQFELKAAEVNCSALVSGWLPLG